jgi:cytosine/adenosine deaminase-related metal-dependent hydrolase
MSDQIRTVSARWIFPVDGAPIERGMIVIANGLIESIGRRDGRSVDRDFPDAALVPGFVNAHTHLELTPIACDETDEIRWLRSVIEHRRRSTPESSAAAIAANLAQAIRLGTTLIGDVTTDFASANITARAPVRSFVYSELLGLKHERGVETTRRAWEIAERLEAERGDDSVSSGVRDDRRLGFSPHAPYSTAGWIYRKAAESGRPLTTHLAETPEEIELLRDRSGRMRDFLESIGAWDENWAPIGSKPSDYLKSEGLDRVDWIVAHGTYLHVSDFSLFRIPTDRDDPRRSIAYCPRTHARFGHAPHPYRRILELGGSVCIGTDGLSSAPTLGVLDELRFVRRIDRSLESETLLRMGTLNGAWAFRLERETGSLTPGKSADIAAVAIPDRNPSDPHELLFDSDLPVVATMFRGGFV